MDQLYNYINLSIQQLLNRYEFQIQKRAQSFPFLYSQNVWKNGKYLALEDTLENVLKEGTLRGGIIGLAEALVALIGKHHGESEEAYKMGYQIIQHMRERKDQAALQYSVKCKINAT